MPIYANTEQLYTNLRRLFDTIQNSDPSVQHSLIMAKMLIRLDLTGPVAQVTINGRQVPVRVIYGKTTLRPDLDVSMSADTFHQILLSELPLTRALANGQMRVRGPIWKTSTLENILHSGQKIYPQVWQSSMVDLP